MKKLLIVLATILVFSGCAKESDNFLVGTSWQTDDYTFSSIVMGYSYHIFEFYSEDKASSYWVDKKGNIVSSDGDVTYTLDYPTMKIKDDTYTFNDRVSFEIKGAGIVYYKK